MLQIGLETIVELERGMRPDREGRERRKQRSSPQQAVRDHAARNQGMAVGELITVDELREKIA